MKFFHDGGGRHLGFVRTRHSSIRSAVNAAKADEMPGCPSSVTSRSSAASISDRHAASLFRSYDFSDTPTGTWKKVICRQVLVHLTSGSPFNNLRNKLLYRLKTGQSDHASVIATADQQCEPSISISITIQFISIIPKSGCSIFISEYVQDYDKHKCGLCFVEFCNQGEAHVAAAIWPFTQRCTTSTYLFNILRF